jgi:hypothetical protein
VSGLLPTARSWKWDPRRAHLGIGDSLALSRHTSKSPVLSALYNPYAAMPSLHMIFAVIAGASIALYARHRWAKIAGLVYPLFVAAEVVATGNHYLLDLAAGAATVAISALATRRVLRPPVPILTASPATWLQPSTPCIGDRAQQAELRLRGSTRLAGETPPLRRDGVRRPIVRSWLLIHDGNRAHTGGSWIRPPWATVAGPLPRRPLRLGLHPCRPGSPDNR